MLGLKYLLEQGTIIAYNMEEGGDVGELVISSTTIEEDNLFLGAFLDIYEKALKNFDFILLENEYCTIELEKDYKTKEFIVFNVTGELEEDRYKKAMEQLYGRAIA